MIRRDVVHRRRVRPLMLTALAVPALGCSTVTSPCDMLNASVSPTGPQQLAVGQSLSARITYTGGCPGGVRTLLADTVTWAARDTTVVRVDAVTGVITGRAPGTTVVVGQGAHYSLGAQVAVTVR